MEGSTVSVGGPLARRAKGKGRGRGKRTYQKVNHWHRLNQFVKNAYDKKSERRLNKKLSPEQLRRRFPLANQRHYHGKVARNAFSKRAWGRNQPIHPVRARSVPQVAGLLGGYVPEDMHAQDSWSVGPSVFVPTVAKYAAPLSRRELRQRFVDSHQQVVAASVRAFVEDEESYAVERIKNTEAWARERLGVMLTEPLELLLATRRDQRVREIASALACCTFAAITRGGREPAGRYARTPVAVALDPHAGRIMHKVLEFDLEEMDDEYAVWVWRPDVATSALTLAAAIVDRLDPTPQHVAWDPADPRPLNLSRFDVASAILDNPEMWPVDSRRAADVLGRAHAHAAVVANIVSSPFSAVTTGAHTNDNADSIRANFLNVNTHLRGGETENEIEDIESALVEIEEEIDGILRNFQTTDREGIDTLMKQALVRYMNIMSDDSSFSESVKRTVVDNLRRDYRGTRPPIEWMDAYRKLEETRRQVDATFHAASIELRASLGNQNVADLKEKVHADQLIGETSVSAFADFCDQNSDRLLCIDEWCKFVAADSIAWRVFDELPENWTNKASAPSVSPQLASYILAEFIKDVTDEMHRKMYNTIKNQGDQVPGADTGVQRVQSEEEYARLLNEWRAQAGRRDEAAFLDCDAYARQYGFGAGQSGVGWAIDAGIKLLEAINGDIDDATAKCNEVAKELRLHRAKLAGIVDRANNLNEIERWMDGEDSNSNEASIGPEFREATWWNTPWCGATVERDGLEALSYLRTRPPVRADDTSVRNELNEYQSMAPAEAVTSGASVALQRASRGAILFKTGSIVAGAVTATLAVPAVSAVAIPVAAVATVAGCVTAARSPDLVRSTASAVGGAAATQVRRIASNPTPDIREDRVAIRMDGKRWFARQVVNAANLAAHIYIPTSAVKDWIPKMEWLNVIDGNIVGATVGLGAISLLTTGESTPVYFKRAGANLPISIRIAEAAHVRLASILHAVRGVIANRSAGTETADDAIHNAQETAKKHLRAMILRRGLAAQAARVVDDEAADNEAFAATIVAREHRRTDVALSAALVLARSDEHTNDDIEQARAVCQAETARLDLQDLEMLVSPTESQKQTRDWNQAVQSIQGLIEAALRPIGDHLTSSNVGQSNDQNDPSSAMRRAVARVFVNLESTLSTMRDNFRFCREIVFACTANGRRSASRYVPESYVRSAINVVRLTARYAASRFVSDLRAEAERNTNIKPYVEDVVRYARTLHWDMKRLGHLQLDVEELGPAVDPNRRGYANLVRAIDWAAKNNPSAKRFQRNIFKGYAMATREVKLATHRLMVEMEREGGKAVEEEPPLPSWGDLPLPDAIKLTAPTPYMLWTASAMVQQSNAVETGAFMAIMRFISVSANVYKMVRTRSLGEGALYSAWLTVQQVINPKYWRYIKWWLTCANTKVVLPVLKEHAGAISDPEPVDASFIRSTIVGWFRWFVPKPPPTSSGYSAVPVERVHGMAREYESRVQMPDEVGPSMTPSALANWVNYFARPFIGEIAGELHPFVQLKQMLDMQQEMGGHFRIATEERADHVDFMIEYVGPDGGICGAALFASNFVMDITSVILTLRASFNSAMLTVISGGAVPRHMWDMPWMCAQQSGMLVGSSKFFDSFQNLGQRAAILAGTHMYVQPRLDEEYLRRLPTMERMIHAQTAIGLGAAFVSVSHSKLPTPTIRDALKIAAFAATGLAAYKFSTAIRRHSLRDISSSMEWATKATLLHYATQFTPTPTPTQSTSSLPAKILGYFGYLVYDTLTGGVANSAHSPIAITTNGFNTVTSISNTLMPEVIGGDIRPDLLRQYTELNQANTGLFAHNPESLCSLNPMRLTAAPGINATADIFGWGDRANPANPWAAMTMQRVRNDLGCAPVVSDPFGMVPDHAEAMQTMAVSNNLDDARKMLRSWAAMYQQTNNGELPTVEFTNTTFKSYMEANPMNSGWVESEIKKMHDEGFTPDKNVAFYGTTEEAAAYHIAGSMLDKSKMGAMPVLQELIPLMQEGVALLAKGVLAILNIENAPIAANPAGAMKPPTVLDAATQLAADLGEAQPHAFVETVNVLSAAYSSLVGIDTAVAGLMSECDTIAQRLYGSSETLRAQLPSRQAMWAQFDSDEFRRRWTRGTFPDDPNMHAILQLPTQADLKMGIFGQAKRIACMARQEGESEESTMRRMLFLAKGAKASDIGECARATIAQARYVYSVFSERLDDMPLIRAASAFRSSQWVDGVYLHVPESGSVLYEGDQMRRVPFPVGEVAMPHLVSVDRKQAYNWQKQCAVDNLEGRIRYAAGGCLVEEGTGRVILDDQVITMERGYEFVSWIGNNRLLALNDFGIPVTIDQHSEKELPLAPKGMTNLVMGDSNTFVAHGRSSFCIIHRDDTDEMDIMGQPAWPPDDTYAADGSEFVERLEQLEQHMSHWFVVTNQGRAFRVGRTRLEFVRDAIAPGTSMAEIAASLDTTATAAAIATAGATEWFRDKLQRVIQGEPRDSLKVRPSTPPPPGVSRDHYWRRVEGMNQMTIGNFPRANSTVGIKLSPNSLLSWWKRSVRRAHSLFDQLLQGDAARAARMPGASAAQRQLAMERETTEQEHARHDAIIDEAMRANYCVIQELRLAVQHLDRTSENTIAIRKGSNEDAIVTLILALADVIRKDQRYSLHRMGIGTMCVVDVEGDDGTGAALWADDDNALWVADRPAVFHYLQTQVEAAGQTLNHRHFLPEALVWGGATVSQPGSQDALKSVMWGDMPVTDPARVKSIWDMTVSRTEMPINLAMRVKHTGKFDPRSGIGVVVSFYLNNNPIGWLLPAVVLIGRITPEDHFDRFDHENFGFDRHNLPRLTLERAVGIDAPRQLLIALNRLPT
jgi:hypothetical protein